MRFVEEGDQFEFPYRPHLFGLDLPNRYDLVFFPPDSIVARELGLELDDIMSTPRSEKNTVYPPKLEPNGVFQFVATDHLRFSGTDWWVKQRKYSISDVY